MSLRGRFLARLCDRLADERFSLRLIFWDREVFEFATQPRVTLTLRSPRPSRYLLAGDIGRLGRAYVEGEIDVEGRLEDVLRIGIALAERLGQSRPTHVAGRLLGWRRHTMSRDSAAVRYHYDVSNEFYRLWLDRNMVYSCAYFEIGEEDLDTAQEQKLDHICRKLRLCPGERLLDIGCGWGGLLRWAALRYGVEGVGITLSDQQFAYAREGVAALGLTQNIEIRRQDYREVPGQAICDKVVSVGMYEHVGITNLPAYFGTIARLLRPAGSRSTTASRPPTATDGRKARRAANSSTAWSFPAARCRISRAFFTKSPARGSSSSTSKTCARTTRRPCCIGRDASKPRARKPSKPPACNATGSGGCICRRWPMRERGWLSAYQVLAQKNQADRLAPRHWTRRHQYLPGEPVRLSNGLDWGDL